MRYFAAGQFQNGFLTGGRMLLRKKPDRGGLLHRDATFVGRRFAENEREERRLARAVGSDQAHAIPAIHLEGRIFKEDATGEGFGDL